MERMMKGKFTLRMLYEQFQSVMKLGPLSKVMDMLPGGIGQMMAGMAGGTGADTTARLKRMMNIMDSMTNKELDGVVVMDESRVWRVAKGSGVHPVEVQQLLDIQKQFGGVIDGMSKTGLLKGGDAAFASKMQRNPNAIMQQMQKSMDPRMVKSLGGMGNLQVCGHAQGGGRGHGCWLVSKPRSVHDRAAPARTPSLASEYGAKTPYPPSSLTPLAVAHERPRATPRRRRWRRRRWRRRRRRGWRRHVWA